MDEAKELKEIIKELDNKVNSLLKINSNNLFDDIYDYKELNNNFDIDELGKVVDIISDYDSYKAFISKHKTNIPSNIIRVMREQQFSLFKHADLNLLMNKEILAKESFWLREVASAKCFCTITLE